jgi:hypothetical protein
VGDHAAVWGVFPSPAGGADDEDDARWPVFLSLPLFRVGGLRPSDPVEVDMVFVLVVEKFYT